MARILLVEDNLELASIVVEFLKKASFSVIHTDNGNDALSQMNDDIDLVLLDLCLPDIDGYYIVDEIRKKRRIPIIIISAKINKESKLLSLELGADDFLEKPFDIDILVAKIKATLRRENKMLSNVIMDGNIFIDKENRIVKIDNKEVLLSVKEYDLLVLFLSNIGKTFRKEFLFNSIWGNESELSTLTVHINKLREKIEKDPKNPKRIKTIWGVGYKYEKMD